MPVIKSAKKKMRVDARRKANNQTVSKNMRQAVKAAASKEGDTVKKAYQAIDKAAKRGVIHKNKAARLKSKIGKKAA